MSCANHILSPDWSNHSVPCMPVANECNVTCPQQGGVDLYTTSAPAYGQNGTYNSYTFNDQAIAMLRVRRVVKDVMRSNS